MAKGKKRKKSRATKSTEPDPNLYYGKGSFILPNGDSYEGDYCAHRVGLIWREGQGVYKTHDGQTYEGEWKDDKLIENKELIIKYPNGAEYYGRLSKNKYKGPGTYTLECKMDVSCNFEGNKPTGTVALVDYDGKLWVGEAKQNKAILFPENVFYLNLLEENGKGYLLEEQTASVKSIEGENGEKESAELTDREWENIIFKRSSKTENDIDFEDSKWVKKFERFRINKEEILRKLEESISLTDEEHLWIEKFKRYEARRKKKEAEYILLKKKASEETMMLLEKFRSPQFIGSCPGVSVIYASPYFSTEIEESEKKISDEDSYDEEDTFHNVCLREDDAEMKEGSNTTIVSYYGLESSGRFKSDRFDNLTKLNDYVKQLEHPKSKLHFTEEREKWRIEVGLKLAQKREEAAEAAAAEAAKMSEKSKVQSEEKRKEKKKGAAKKTKDASEISSAKKKASIPSKTPIDEKVAFQERIKKYVEEYFEAKEKIEEKSETALPKIEAHTHNIAVRTESADIIEMN